MNAKVGIVALLVLVLASLLILWLSPAGRYTGWAWRRVTGGATVEQRLAQYGPAARAQMRPYFDNAGVAYPPAEVVMVGIKDQNMLVVWARNAEQPFAHIHTYPVLAASGGPGPKLREGDRQVPEGLYRVESLHPNSMFHLALRVNYPNEFDRQQAQNDGRTNLGGDIMIHGHNTSAGCLAMGDPAIEQLFILAADTGIENIRLIFTPVDFRTTPLPHDSSDLPLWTQSLYEQIKAAMAPLVSAE